WDEAIKLVETAMKGQNLRDRSIGEYLASLVGLRKVYPDSQGPGDITVQQAKQYKLARQQQGVRPRTLAGNISNLSIVWGKWFRDECKILETNPWEEVERPKLDKPTPRYIEPDEEMKFISWLTERWNGWRLPVLFMEVKGLIGCRILELCSVPS